jgi:hypothetical protein
MGQRRITIEVTEQQAAAIAYAMERAGMVNFTQKQAGANGRTSEWRKFQEALAIVREATQGLKVFETFPKSIPKLPANRGGLSRFR